MPRPSRRATTGRRPHRGRAIAALGVGALALLTVIGAGLLTLLHHPGQSAPGHGTRIVVPAGSAAALAAEDPDAADTERAAAAYLAAQPTAAWLTPESYDETAVGDRILDLAAQARTQRASLAVVVYGIPARDCGNLSAGGLADAAAYHGWTAAIGAALDTAADVRAVIVLEPDSLALAPDCGNVDERVSELRRAVADLEGPDRWIYLDGGHSHWLPVAEMAELIRQVGTDGVRGFATNVSNYNPTPDEIDYAHRLAAAVGGGVHALIDTGRNGAGTADGEWCNPPRQIVGEPGGSLGDDVVDTNLWIKPPGESDGACNGGPPAGRWWPESAAELTRNAR